MILEWISNNHFIFLNINHNNFIELPQADVDIINCENSKLLYLHCAKNEITILPLLLSKTLKFLDISWNKFTINPEKSISNLSNLQTYHNLNYGTQISAEGLPKSICGLCC